MKLTPHDINTKNLSDLRFAVKLLMDDFEEAIKELGIDADYGERLIRMMPDQQKQLAKADVLLFGFRLTAGQVASAASLAEQF